jgi:hypothetical protein
MLIPRSPCLHEAGAAEGCARIHVIQHKLTRPAKRGPINNMPSGMNMA